MAVRSYGDPGYDAFNIFNPADWFGAHDDTSMFKSEAQNRAILEARAKAKAPKTARKDLARYRKDRDRMRARDVQRQRDYRDERDRFAKASRGRLSRDTGYWDKRREGAYSDWKSVLADLTGRLESGLAEQRDAWYRPEYREDYLKAKDLLISSADAWRSDFDSTKDSLRGIKDDVLGLVSEVRRAPSSVAEQARIAQDDALRQSVAMAGAFGGSLAGGYNALRNRANIAQGQTLRDTSALRGKEYIDRIGMQANLLQQARSPILDLAKLNATDTDISQKISSDLYEMMSSERAGETGFLGGLLDKDLGFRGSLGQQDFENMLNLGTTNFDIGTGAQARRRGILGSLGQVLAFNRAGDQNYLSTGQNAFNMANALDVQDYNRMRTERAYQDAQLAKIAKQRSGILGWVGRIGGGILGGLVGGPAGASAGQQLGGSVLGGGGGTQQLAQTGTPKFFNLLGGDNSGIPGYVQPVATGGPLSSPQSIFSSPQTSNLPLRTESINPRYFERARSGGFSRSPGYTKDIVSLFGG